MAKDTHHEEPINEEYDEEMDEMEEDLSEGDALSDVGDHLALVFGITVEPGKIFQTRVDPNMILNITGASLSSDNPCTERHVLELCYGKDLSERVVIARLLPNVVETVSLDLTVSAHEQALAFALAEGSGSVDVTGFFEMHAGDSDSEFDSEGSYESHDEEADTAESAEESEPTSESEPEKRPEPVHEPSPKAKGKGPEGKAATPKAQKPESPAKDAPKGAAKASPGAPKAANGANGTNGAKEMMDKLEGQKKQASEKGSPQPAAKDAPQKGSPQKDKKQGGDAAGFRDVKGVKVNDNKVGNGPEAKAGSKVTCSYVLRLGDKAGKVVDQSGKKKFQFTLGRGEVIAGWDIGLAGMKVGGRRTLIVPPHLGYGKKGAGNDVPGNATLYFETELFGVN